MKKITYSHLMYFGLSKGILLLLISLVTLSACEKKYGQGEDRIFLKPNATVSNAANEHVFTGSYATYWWFMSLDENDRPILIDPKDTTKLKYTFEPADGKIIKTVEGPWYKIEIIDKKNVRFVVKANTTGLRRSVSLNTQHYNTFEDLKLVQEP